MGNQKGVTLLEMISAMLIIGVVSGIAFPAYKALIDRYRFTTETARVVDAFRLAKSYALTRNTRVVFTYHRDGYLVFVDDGAAGGVAGDWIRQPGELLLFDCDLSGQGLAIDVDGSTFSAQRTRFSGKPGIKAGSLVLLGKDGTKNRIVVNIIGRVRVEKTI